jgi:hypothetical protein
MFEQRYICKRGLIVQCGTEFQEKMREGKGQESNPNPEHPQLQNKYRQFAHHWKWPAKSKSTSLW